MLELLAPTDQQSFDVAINCGADAVYLGLEGFNARAKADNFDGESLVEAVRKAHFYGVKVYATVNTIVQNHELKDVLRIVKAAVEAKVDAFIVQDFGEIKMLKEVFPNIVIHLSTQAGVHNLYGAIVAERMGVKRVVLSRETTLKDIEEIRANTELELEYFVQGALCVAFSGNCYMSARAYGASGNRGECKQLCRLCYTAKTYKKSESAYMLSARDLCLAPSLEELVRAGITSFKIEGRLRRAGYIGEAVHVYRRLIDSIERGEHATYDDRDEEALRIAFSRGEPLDRAYLDGDVPNIIEKKFNNHTGIHIGKAIAVKPFKAGLYEVTLLSSHKLGGGDGLKFFADGREAASLGVGEIKEIGNNKYSFVTTVKVPVGAQAHLISDRAEEDRVARIRRYRDVDIEVRAMCGEPLSIAAIARPLGDGLALGERAVQDGVLEAARTAPLDEAELRLQASKTADTGFNVLSCKVVTNGVFAPKSVINSLRREALAKLKERLIEDNEYDSGFDEERYNYYSRLAFEEGSVPEDRLLPIRSEESGEVKLSGSDSPVLQLADFNDDSVEKAMSRIRLKSGAADEEDVILQLPVIANGEDIKCIEKLLLRHSGITTLLAENIYGLYFASQGYSVIAGAGLNIANDLALASCLELGASAALPSSEYPSGLGGESLFSMQEELPDMTLAHCPYKTLFENDCRKCSFTGDMTLSGGGRTYKVRRIRLSRCYFQLFRR